MHLLERILRTTAMLLNPQFLRWSVRYRNTSNTGEYAEHGLIRYAHCTQHAPGKETRATDARTAMNCHRTPITQATHDLFNQTLGLKHRRRNATIGNRERNKCNTESFAKFTFGFQTEFPHLRPLKQLHHSSYLAKAPCCHFFRKPFATSRTRHDCQPRRLHLGDPA